MYDKKAIGAVVATALMLVVAVFAIVGFQSWFNTYSSQILTNAETSTDVPAIIKVVDIIGDSVYLSAKGLTQNEQVTEFKIQDQDSGNEICNFESLKDGLTGYYKLDEDVLDSSGNGRDGTQNGGNFVKGISGQGIELNGNYEYIDLNSFGNKFITSENGTISVWFKNKGNLINGDFNTDPNIFNYIISLSIPNTNSPGIGVIVGNFSNLGNNFGVVNFRAWSISTFGSIDKIETKYNKKNWINIIWYLDNNKFRIYKNGKLVNEMSPNGITTGSITFNNFHIGGDGNSLKSFNGSIDEVRFYNRSLSDAEIKNLYSSIIKNGNIEFDISECNLKKNKDYSGVIVTNKQVLNYKFYYN